MFILGAAVIPLCSDPQVCSPPWSLLPQLSLCSCDFYLRASHDSLPPHAPGILNVRTGQLTFGDFHPIRSAALPAAPKLYDPLTYEESKFAPRDVQGGKPIAKEKIRVVIKRTNDSRSDKTRLGGLVQYGVTRTILFDKDVALSDLFTNNLINCFELAGYEVILPEKFEAASESDKEKADALVESDVMGFSVSMYMLPLEGNYVRGFVRFNVKLYEPETLREIWGDRFMGVSESWGIFDTRSRYEGIINQAYAKAMSDLFKAISDNKIRDILKGTSKNSL